MITEYIVIKSSLTGLYHVREKQTKNLMFLNQTLKQCKIWIEKNKELQC